MVLEQRAFNAKVVGSSPTGGIRSGLGANIRSIEQRRIDEELEAPVPLRKNAGRPPDPNRRCPVEVRECRRHGPTEFGFYGINSKRPRWKCKRCVAEAVTRRHQKVKRILVEEAGGSCAVCDYKRTIINLLSMAAGRSLAAYRKEVEKCVLVCANCHGEIEAGVMESPPPRATYKDYGAKLGELRPAA